MALSATHVHFDASAIGAAIARPFKAVFRGLIVLAEADSRMVQVRKLNELSDEDLTALGTTRQDEVSRIFGASLYI
ncbi:hypothetical protein [Octadecabacter sp. R77987]|uniref:hypothetical protein n=1 Tax=Octadecabacter sp. R77987 TaxID=3093874 RepID=UPI00366BD99C